MRTSIWKSEGGQFLVFTFMGFLIQSKAHTWSNPKLGSSTSTCCSSCSWLADSPVRCYLVAKWFCLGLQHRSEWVLHVAGRPPSIQGLSFQTGSAMVISPYLGSKRDRGSYGQSMMGHP